MDAFDPYHIWLAIPPAKQPPNHYDLLGIPPFESNTEVIAYAADQRMGHLRNLATGKYSELSQKLLNEVAAAKLCLLNAQSKSGYDVELLWQNQLTGESEPSGPEIQTTGSTTRETLAPRVTSPRSSRTKRQRERTVLLYSLLVVFVTFGGLVVLLFYVGRGNARPKTDNKQEEQTTEFRVDKDPLGGLGPNGEMPIGQWFYVLGLVDPQVHSVAGEWARQEEAIRTVATADHARFMLPTEVAGSYELYFEFTAIDGKEIFATLPVGETGCQLWFGAFDGTLSGITAIDGQNIDVNPTRKSLSGLVTNSRHAVEVKVSVLGGKAWIHVDLDGRRYLDWNGLEKSLTLREDCLLPHKRAIGLGSWNAHAIFHTARVRMLSGSGVINVP